MAKKSDKKYKLLIVDDDEDILSTMTYAVEEKFDGDIFHARDGDEALKVALEEKPQIIILDLMLPKRGGFLILQRIKGKAREGKVPLVVMVTGNEGARHLVFAKSLGADGYLRKPFPMFRLTECIEGFVDKLNKMKSTKW